MVSDPRVTAALSRLGGVYRDPARVDRDASSLLRSSVGTHLNPLIAEMVENNGDTVHCLVLQGTIAMHFRGQTYQLLMDIYLPSGYPVRPPTCFVRLAPNMYLKENHRHVGMDGKVYLPYLHEWNRQSHNLVELVVAMSSVFSAEPPVFSRPPPPPPPVCTTSLPTVTPTTSSNMNSNNSGAWTPTPPPQPPNMPSGGTGVDSEREAVLLVEIAEANAAAEASRRAELLEEQERVRKLQLQQEERQRNEATQAQRRYEEERLKQVKEQVSIKIRTQLVTTAQECRQNLQSDARDKQRLDLAHEQKIQRQLQIYTDAHQKLTQQLQVVETKTIEIQEWIQEAEEKSREAEEMSEQDGAGAVATTIDDRVQPANALHGQMMALSAENNSISDVLYFLDRALYTGHLDCEAHLRQVRKLAKRQFLLRAHLLRISQVAIQESSCQK